MSSSAIEHRLRVVGWVEGTSWLLLFGVAMPLKYLANEPGPVRVVGLIHGILALAYLATLTFTAWKLRWSALTLLAGFAASVLPFGPWIFDAWRKRQTV